MHEWISQFLSLLGCVKWVTYFLWYEILVEHLIVSHRH